MLEIIWENKFLKEMKLSEKRNLNMSRLYDIIEILQNNKPLPRKYKNHSLKGKYSEYSELHIENDWLLIYTKNTTQLILHRIGTHSDLF